MQQLKSVNVTFHTSDDDKRAESNIWMALKDNAGNTVAQAEGGYGKFDNNTTNGPYGLQVLTPANIDQVSPGGVFVLGWTPWHSCVAFVCSTDEWHLSGMSVELIFSDGANTSHVFITPGAYQMTGSQTQVEFGVPGH